MREAIRKRGGDKEGGGWRVIDSRPREIVNVLFGILGKEEEKEEEKKGGGVGRRGGWPVEGKRKPEGVTRSLSPVPSQTLSLTRFPFRLRTYTHTGAHMRARRSSRERGVGRGAGALLRAHAPTSPLIFF